MESQFQGESRFGLQEWAQRLFIAAVFLFPLIVVPVAWFPLLLLKTVLFAVLTLAGLLLFGVHAFKRGGFSLPKSALVWAVIALPVVYAISSAFSQNKVLSFMGSGVEGNTLYFAVLCALAALVGSAVLSTRRGVSSALLSLFASLSIIALFQILQIAFGPNIFGLHVFSSLSSNLVGKWNDFGLLMGLLAVFSMAAIDLARPKKLSLGVCVVALIVGLGFLAVLNLDSAWEAVAVLAVMVGIATIVGTEALVDPMLPRTRRAPYASIVVLVIAALFIAWGNQVSAKISTIIPISEIEVRPAISTTFDILKSTYHQSARTAVVGTGPGTFGEQWIMYKPLAVNTTQFWNMDFQGGSGVITTAFITTGLLGGLTWIAIILLLIFLIVRAVRRPSADPLLQSVLLLASFGALFLLISSALYLAGEVPLLLAFTLIAIALAALKLGFAREQYLAFRGGNFLRATGAIATFLVLFGTAATVSAFSLQRFDASMYLGRALSTPQGNLTLAKEYATTAARLYPSDEIYRLLSNVEFAQAQAISNENAASSTDQAARFQGAFADAVASGKQAVAADPRNYQNYALLAQIFEALVPLKVNGSAESSRQNYEEAIKRNQLNPGLFLAKARMEAQAGNEENFKQAIQSAFSLKPNYTEAALLVLQVEVARNNIDGAIIAAEVASRTAPQNPGILFQVGLLKYAKGDAAGARDAFEEAVKLQPDYANAKYFLGLTYQKLQRVPEAITLFQDLRKTNPDNPEVALILSNMQAGRDPFASSTPPITPNPETRETAPINE